MSKSDLRQVHNLGPGYKKDVIYGISSFGGCLFNVEHLQEYAKAGLLHVCSRDESQISFLGITTLRNHTSHGMPSLSSRVSVVV
ncbi:hypothetical protein SDJN03_08197, partial [Cucurbita argyrosperma subsp. sororia]